MRGSFWGWWSTEGSLLFVASGYCSDIGTLSVQGSPVIGCVSFWSAGLKAARHLRVSNSRRALCAEMGDKWCPLFTIHSTDLLGQKTQQPFLQSCLRDRLWSTGFSTSVLAWSILLTSSPEKQEVTLDRYPSLGKQICLASPGCRTLLGLWGRVQEPRRDQGSWGKYARGE